MAFPEVAISAVAVPAAADSAAADTTAAGSVSADSARAGPLSVKGDVSPAVRDSIRHVKPFLVMARSAVVPGWGQVYNRQPLKAAVVVAGEGFLAYKIFQELKRQNQAIDRQVAAAIAGDSTAYFDAIADQESHKNRKIDWIWWTAAAHLLQMADAYVDAHFLNFDAEFGPDDRRQGSRGAPRLSLSLRVRF